MEKVLPTRSKINIQISYVQRSFFSNEQCCNLQGCTSTYARKVNASLVPKARACASVTPSAVGTVRPATVTAATTLVRWTSPDQETGRGATTTTTWPPPPAPVASGSERSGAGGSEAGAWAGHGGGQSGGGEGVPRMPLALAGAPAGSTAPPGPCLAGAGLKAKQITTRKFRKHKQNITSNIWTHIWSTKWSLFTKNFAWMACKSRDESNKPT